MSFAAGAIALANLSSILLMTLGRHRSLVVATVLVTALGAGLDYLVVRLGYDITGVAWATLATFTVSGLVLPWLALGGLELAAGRRLLHLGRFMAPLGLSLLLSYGVDHLLPRAETPSIGSHLARMALGVLAFVGAYALGCLPLVRGLGLRQLVSEFNLPIPGFGRPPERPRE
jgi:hypothetical protein